MSALERVDPADIERTANMPAVPADQYISMIERVVMDPTLPIERLERMLDLKDRMEDRARADEERAARRAYFAAMSKCQAELPVVTKNRKNEHTKSKYADLAAIEQQAMPIIHAHGFAVSFQPAGYNEQGELQIKWRISHAEGHSESDIAGVPVDGVGSQGKVNKTGTQAFGSTATYGRRYLLCMLFNITTGDDTDGNAAAKDDDDWLTEEQVEVILDLIDKTGTDIALFCETMKIEAIPDMRPKDYPGAVDVLKMKLARKLSEAKNA